MDITVKRIFYLLENRKIEQKELADYLGTNKQTITDWKRGKTKSYNKNIDKIAEFFGVSVDYLLGLTDSVNNSFSISNRNTIISGTQANVINNHDESDTFLEEFMQIFSKLSFENKVKVMKYVNDIRNATSESSE